MAAIPIPAVVAGAVTERDQKRAFPADSTQSAERRAPDRSCALHAPKLASGLTRQVRRWPRHISLMKYIDARMWVQVWREAGPRLEAIRREEIRQTDTMAMVSAFDDASARRD